MKKKTLALLMSAALAVTTLVVPNVSAGATSVTSPTSITGSADDSTPTTATWDNSTNSASPEVYAGVLNPGNKITYSVEISWGAMEFEYDFGQTWDPVNHVYNMGDSNVAGGGWVTRYLDGSNNIITITNNSNYPVNVAMKYTHDTTSSGGSKFNAKKNTAKSVIGFFYTQDTFDAGSMEDDINSTDYQQGYSINTTTHTEVIQTPTFNLDWAYTDLTGSGYLSYGRLKSGVTNYQTTSVNYYFAFCGIPDKKCALITDGAVANSTEKVGSITVTVTPASGTDVDTTTATL